MKSVRARRMARIATSKWPDSRNETAHGGNIAVDTYILMSMKQEDNSKLEQCRLKYRKMYGVDYQTIVHDIWNAPTCDHQDIRLPSSLEAFEEMGVRKRGY